MTDESLSGARLPWCVIVGDWNRGVSGNHVAGPFADFREALEWGRAHANACWRAMAQCDEDLRRHDFFLQPLRGKEAPG